jgi:hypothetical protein
MKDEFKRALMIQYNRNPLIHNQIESLSSLLIDKPELEDKMKLAEELFEPFFIAGMIHGGKMKDMTQEQRDILKRSEDQVTDFDKYFKDEPYKSFEERNRFMKSTQRGLTHMMNDLFEITHVDIMNPPDKFKGLEEYCGVDKAIPGGDWSAAINENVPDGKVILVNGSTYGKPPLEKVIGLLKKYDDVRKINDIIKDQIKE